MSLGKYRAKCAEEQIDLDSLCLFGDESDDSLENDIGISTEDIPAFRTATTKAAEVSKY